MHAVTLDEARDQLADLVEEAMKGEDVVILKDSAPAVKLVAMPVLGVPRFGSGKDSILYIADDFDAPWELRQIT